MVGEIGNPGPKLDSEGEIKEKGEGIRTEVVSFNGFIGCQSLLQVCCLVQPVVSIIEVWVGG